LKRGRLNIGVLGTAKPAIAIAQALQQAGHQVVAVSISSDNANQDLEVLLPFAQTLPDQQIIQNSELVLLGVEADQIQATVANLLDYWKPGQLLIHLAAEFGYEILKPATDKGVIPLAIHPAMSFTGTSLDLNRIKESYCAVSAPVVALPIAQALVIEMGAEPLVLESSERASYAEAIAVAGNFSAMIVNQAIGLLEQAGVENPALVIAPVIESAVDQALSKGHRQIDPEDLLGDS
jgi:predicted short-subunit dehydrogenase-like oxidoreductase (DUF2520 family)